MRLVFLGDLVHRGPDTLGCVRRVQELKAECIKGNHEEKLLRWRKHEQNRLDTGATNPMKPISDDEKQANLSLSDSDLIWLKNLPLKLHLGDNWWAVHAGCEPRYSLQNQNSSQIMRVRYVDERGIGRALGPNLTQPEGTSYWDTQWSGPESIVYGHCVHDLKEIRHRVNNKIHCVGIDTGCCFGGHLTALISEEWPDFNLVQVKAKQAYSSRGGEE